MTTITGHLVYRVSVPLDDFGIAKNLLDDLENQPKRARKTRFNNVRKFLLFAKVITAKETIHSVAKGLDAAGNLTAEITYTWERKE